MCYHLIEVNQRSSMATIHRLPITKARINLGQIARRAHNSKEYFILEKDGIPVIGIMAADEMEDYLELRDQKVKASIAASARDRAAGKTRPAAKVLAELRRSAVRKTAGSGPATHRSGQSESIHSSAISSRKSGLRYLMRP